jgi:molybdenum cofactor cytidylyltransferase
MKISGVLLAAGKSERMGKNKMLLPFGKHAVIEESLKNLIDSGPDEIIVVTGFQHEKITALIEPKYWESIRVIHNENYELGRAESIKCALKNIHKDADAVLFVVADKPTVNSLVIKKAMFEFKESNPSILYVQTPSGRGHPVIFSREIFSDLTQLKGEPVGEVIFEKYRDDTVIIYDENPQVDIDTVEDYNNLLREISK